MSGDPAYDAQDPPLPGEEPTPAMEGESPVEPMAGGGEVRDRPSLMADVEAATAWRTLVALRHHPTCAIVLFLQTRDHHDMALIFPLPSCTCGADLVRSHL